MIVKKMFRKVAGFGMRQKVCDVEGWYLFGVIPLYVRINIVK